VHNLQLETVRISEEGGEISIPITSLTAVIDRRIEDGGVDFEHRLVDALNRRLALGVKCEMMRPGFVAI
jgi:hypothetical protein